MWMQQLWLAVIGLSAGAVVAGGVFSFIIGLGVVSDFADRTHTGEHIRLYEDAIALGGILGCRQNMDYPQLCGKTRRAVPPEKLLA